MNPEAISAINILFATFLLTYSARSPLVQGRGVNRGVYKSFQEKKSKMQQLNQKIRSSSGYSFQRGRRNPLEFKKSKNRGQKANLPLFRNL